MSTSAPLCSFNFFGSQLLVSDLLVQDVPKPRYFWELEQDVQVQPWVGALNDDQEMMVEY